jgi:NADPH-dependent glutamate synthase beta subunit-like oxidoreductase/ferredoxin
MSKNVKFSYDGHEIEGEEGSPLIDAAREAGYSIPSMCYLKDHDAQNSCLTCVVKINGNPNLVPSCSRPIEEGMVVESDCEDVWEVRKTALELILSDHIGNCYAPCTAVCPARMEIPQMLRQVTEGDYEAAAKTIKRDIPFPAILGRICPEACEGGCRRGRYDTPEAINGIERFVGDQDLMSAQPYLPPIQADTGKTVAIVGAGLAGLTAAYYLKAEGYSVDIFEQSNTLGGSLSTQFSQDILPATVLEKEWSLLQKMGLHAQTGKTLGQNLELSELISSHDAIVLALGRVDEEMLVAQGLKLKGKKLAIDKKTQQSNLQKVFIAGAMNHGKDRKVYSIAEGKGAMVSVHQFLSGKPVVGREKRFNSIVPPMNHDSIHLTLEKVVNQKDRYAFPETKGTSFSQTEQPGYENQVASLEASRCLHCDCRAKDACDLRDYSELVGANQKHYKGHMRGFAPLNQVDGLHLDSGKCLQCGLCVQLAKDAGEPIGLAHRGRGFNTEIVVPFDLPLDKALTHSAKACAKACPTGAISFKDEAPTIFNPHDLVESQKPKSTESS